MMGQGVPRPSGYTPRLFRARSGRPAASSMSRRRSLAAASDRFAAAAPCVMLLLVPAFVTNVWQLLAGPRVGALVARLWPTLLAIVVGTLIGATLLAEGDTARATTALGSALAV